MDAIDVRHVSKRYRLGERQAGAMLREVLTSGVKRLFRKKATRTDFHWALRDISFRVQQQEIVGIIGRNGAGKTTLLKVLSRITDPTAGTFTTRGRVASLVEVGTGFHQELTGRENIFLNGSILGLRKKEIQRNFDAIVEFAGVEPFVDTPIKRYSTGMRLRLGFAVAAHLASDILLVDEVLAVGDAEFQRKCLTALHRVQASGRTVLFVSHNLEAVERLCPRTMWIDEGRIRLEGRTSEVIPSYLATVSETPEGALDLSQMKGRSGSGEARYTKIEYIDADDQPTTTIRTGEAVTLRLHYEVQRDVRHPHFGVMFFTERGTLAAHPNTWSSGADTPTLHPGRGRLDLRIDSLNLLPGRYHLTLWIQRRGDHTSYDLLEHCVVLPVHSPAGAAAPRSVGRPGHVFLPCSWVHYT